MTYNIDITGSAETLNGKPGSFYLNSATYTDFTSYTATVTTKNNGQPYPQNYGYSEYIKLGRICKVSYRLNLGTPLINNSQVLISLPFTANHTQFAGLCWYSIRDDGPSGSSGPSVYFTNGLGGQFSRNENTATRGAGIVGTNTFFVVDNLYGLTSSARSDTLANKWFIATFSYITNS